VSEDQPHAKKPVYIPRPTNITDVSSARGFRFFSGLALAANPNAVPDTAEEKYEVVYLG
jgi:hypothetical protein